MLDYENNLSYPSHNFSLLVSKESFNGNKLKDQQEIHFGLDKLTLILHKNARKLIFLISVLNVIKRIFLYLKFMLCMISL